MSVSSVTNATSSVYGTYQAAGESKASAAKSVSEQSAAQSAAPEAGVVYEKSSADVNVKASYSVNKMSAEDREALVQQLKQDQEARQNSFMDIVHKMIGKQAQASNLASLFSPENLKNLDPRIIAQAKEDVSENGYYGVKQTSQRLFDFASALAGDDVEKMKKMQAAMQKGFDKATRAWGRKLPQISQDTIAASHQLFEDYYASKSAVE